MWKFFVIVAALAAMSPAEACGQRPEGSRGIIQILSDRTLWGEGFPGALSALPAFQKAGEQQVAVFADRLVGENRFRSREEAEREARSVAEALRAPDSRFTEARQKLFGGQESLPLEPRVIELLDDATFRVAIPASGASLLPPGLQVAAVRERLGEPEKITTVLLDDGTERRPVVLTLYHYAGGAIAFAESNVAVRPGFINRVFLNVPAVTAAILEAAR